MGNIAVLLTCYNRKGKTINCLKSLYKAINLSNYEIKFDIYLVDDGSTDGTAKEISVNFPEVIIIKGSGNLFWAGGMRLAWKTALISDPDYYLLLNDDTFLFGDAISKIVDNSNDFYTENSNHAIFIGSTKTMETGLISFGGRKLYSKYSPKNYLLQNDQYCMECDLGSANIMLVPRSIVQKIGILSDKYTHGIADYDYTLKAKKEGFKVLVTPGILGACVFDHGRGWLPVSTTLKERIQYLNSPKGLAYKEYLYYIKKHFPLYLPSAFLKLWLKTLFPFIFDKFKKVQTN